MSRQNFIRDLLGTVPANPLDLVIPEEPIGQGECRLSVDDDRFLFYFAGIGMEEQLLSIEEIAFVENHFEECPVCRRENRIHRRYARYIEGDTTVSAASPTTMPS